MKDEFNDRATVAAERKGKGRKREKEKGKSFRCERVAGLCEAGKTSSFLLFSRFLAAAEIGDIGSIYISSSVDLLILIEFGHMLPSFFTLYHFFRLGFFSFSWSRLRR